MEQASFSLEWKSVGVLDDEGDEDDKMNCRVLNEVKVEMTNKRSAK